VNLFALSHVFPSRATARGKSMNLNAQAAVPARLNARYSAYPRSDAARRGISSVAAGDINCQIKRRLLKNICSEHVSGVE